MIDITSFPFPFALSLTLPLINGHSLTVQLHPEFRWNFLHECTHSKRRISNFQISMSENRYCKANTLTTQKAKIPTFRQSDQKTNKQLNLSASIYAMLGSSNIMCIAYCVRGPFMAFMVVYTLFIHKNIRNGSNQS